MGRNFDKTIKQKIAEGLARKAKQEKINSGKGCYSFRLAALVAMS